MSNITPTNPPVNNRYNLPPNDPNLMMLNFFHSGSEAQKKMAEAMEEQTVAKSSDVVIYSMKCEEWLSKYVGEHESVIKLKQRVRKLAVVPDPVLILGESGTGKELIARALHGRRVGKFTAVNCTALPSELLESELFGHEVGAFTGATSKRLGVFRGTDRGTVFLDEIGDMPLEMQAKLLRVLQERVVTPLGSDKLPEEINCRIIAATNKTSLELEVCVRPDLLMRLGVFSVHTTPVRDRGDDWMEILDSIGAEKLVSELSKNGTNLHPFTGNVRYLQAIARRYMVLNEMP